MVLSAHTELRPGHGDGVAEAERSSRADIADVADFLGGFAARVYGAQGGVDVFDGADAVV